MVWRGSADDAGTAADAFFTAVAAAAGRRGYAIDAGTAVAQTLAVANLAADHAVRRCRRYGRELMVVEVDGPMDVARNHVGGGYLLSLRIDALTDLTPFLNRSDQTMTQFGFAEAELLDFAARAAGSGDIDRIIAFGQALTFDRFWDGYDLLDAFIHADREGDGGHRSTDLGVALQRPGAGQLSRPGEADRPRRQAR